MSAATGGWQALGRVQEFVGKLYSTILLLDAEDRYFGTGQPGAAAGEFDSLHAQFFEHMAAVRAELDQGQRLAAVLREYAARYDDRALALATGSHGSGIDPLAAIHALNEAGSLLAAIGRDLEDAAAHRKEGAAGGSQPPRPQVQATH